MLKEKDFSSRNEDITSDGNTSKSTTIHPIFSKLFLQIS